MYHENKNEEKNQNIIDLKLLTKYISYSKEKIHPELSEDAMKALVKGYGDLRRLGLK
jgi:DNA replication licensing factor MCM4